jgi:phosphatidyl-myo-inositol alpha-mannosyltransferase
VSAPLAIAIVCPTAWPPGDDIAWRIHEEAHALARRGHRVTVFAPGTRARDLRDGTARISRSGAGHATAIQAAPGTPRVVIVGRARRTGSRLGVSPFDTASQLEAAISHGDFDVVHVHEPLTPTPGLSVLRRATGVTATTFHRPDPMTGAAFMGSLVQGAIARVDIRIATSKTVELAVTQILGGTLTVMPWGGHPSVPHPPANGIAIVARGRDRAGLRFAVAVARLVSREVRGPIALMGAREAPWRVRTAVPKALRDDITIIPDTGPDSWHRLLAQAAIVLLGTPGDVDGPVAAQAMADGRVVVAPRSPEADVRLEEGRDGVVLAPFVREPWAEAVRELLADPDRRTAIGHQAVAVSISWDEIAEALEVAYTDALGHHQRGTAPSEARVIADLRIRPTADEDPTRLAAACWDAGLDVVAIASPDGVKVASAIAAAAPAELTVIRGQEIASADGSVVGLFLSQDVPSGRSFAETADLIHAQGGVVLIPHPAAAVTPSAAVLRTHAARVDCLELASPAGGPAQRPVLRAARELGLVISAGSGAAGPAGLGAVGVEMRPFGDGRDFIEALAESELIRPRRRRARRTRAARRSS